MACVVALLHDAGGRQASCDAGAFDSHGWTLKDTWKGKAAVRKNGETPGRSRWKAILKSWNSCMFDGFAISTSLLDVSFVEDTADISVSKLSSSGATGESQVLCGF